MNQTQLVMSKFGFSLQYVRCNYPEVLIAGLLDGPSQGWVEGLD